MARLFRQSRGLDAQRPVNLEAIAAEDRIEVAESEFSQPGYVASLIRVEGATGILLAKGLERGRRRFSIAHELGHFHIPSHSRFSRRPCDDGAMRAGANKSASEVEVEANQFATELLMPYRQFGKDAHGLDLSLRAAAQLASPEMYDVSVMAAARRMLETTREAGLLVVSENGRALWCHASRQWSLRWPVRGEVLAAQTVAAAVVRGETATGNAEEVDFAAWFSGDSRNVKTLVESAWNIPSTGQVMSLLWLPDPDELE